MEASNGHHGLPVKQGNNRLNDFFSNADTQAALEFISEILDLFSLKETFSLNLIIDYNKLYVQLQKASWAFAGFNVLCDWIGSGEIFEYQSQELSLQQYWDNIALKKAEEAIKYAGILPCRSNKQLDPLNELLDLPENSQLTPLQALCWDIPLVDKPQLFIIEDQTGSGKTEASLILLNRMMSQGLADGFYLALPTMATADGIFPRVQKTYDKLYLPDEKPSLVLSHSSARISDKFIETIISPEHPISEQKYGDDAQSRCQAWLADNRKKALLSHVGVGTIDQAFLAVLKTKYQSLRLIGLIGKVLVIDEAHAYDAYMGKELEVLLQVHAALGGSAIIMSATLPLRTRQKLAEAFLKGIDSDGLELEKKKTYPLLTHIAKGFKKEMPFSGKAIGSKKDVQVSFKYFEDEIDQIIKQSIEQDRCVCWIRNSVKDARQAYERLKDAGLKAQLFHSRFTIADRLDIQDQVIKFFGKKSGFNERKGRLLIATQVVEQSLDLDFDVMITDLAPVDLVTMGVFNTIDFENGYTMDGQEWQEDLKMPTRLGEETLILTLAKWENGKITPFNQTGRRPWQNSEIRALINNISKIPPFDGELKTVFEKIEQSLPNQGKWINLLPMVWNHKEKVWEADVIDGREQHTKVYYHAEQGLIYAYELESKQTDEQLETEELI